MSKRRSNTANSVNNEQILQMLRDLADIEQNPFKRSAYEKAFESVSAAKIQIGSGSDAIALPGIGKKIAEKIDIMLANGSLPQLDDAKVVRELTGVFGIGPVMARRLVAMGITRATLAEASLRDPKLLTEQQKLGLRYADNIAQRIPREEITRFETECQVSRLGFKVTFCGSYRREVSESGDVDILITPMTKSAESMTLANVVQKMHNVTAILAMGKTKAMLIAKLQQDRPYRRIDVRLLKPSEYWFGVLYFTGSDIFNKIMRQKAKELGFRLNEYSLHTPDGPCIANSEEDIFKALNMPFTPPAARATARSAAHHGDIS